MIKCVLLAGVIVQWLIVFVDVAKNSLVPITQVRWLTTAGDSRSRGYSALLWPLQVLTLICIYPHTNNLKIK